MSRLRALVAVLLLVGLGAAGMQAWRMLDTPVEVVRIEGDLRAAERERAAALISAQLPATILTLDTGALRRLLEQESWVAGVAIWRRWPDTLRLRVEPESAVARWRDGALLSSRGRVIQPLTPDTHEALPHLLGPRGSEVEVMALFQRINDALRTHDVRVARLQLMADRNIRAELSEGAALMLQQQGLAGQLERLDVLLAGPLGGRMAEVARLDARYDNGVAVAWQGRTSSVAQLAKGF